MRVPSVNPHPIHYFGYGAMRDYDVVKAVIGRGPSGTKATLKGYELIIQRLPDVPPALKHGLERTWGPGYGAYRIRLGDDNSHVTGVAWEINEEELGLIKNWEGNGVWTQTIEEEVFTYEGSYVKAVSDAVSGESTGGVILGSYFTFLNEKEKVVAVAEEERINYLREHQAGQKERS